MAEIVQNSKGFLVLKTTREEILSANSLNLGICDSCNVSCNEGYFVAVLNYWMCPACYLKWQEKAINYKEDQQFEKVTFINMCRALNVNILRALHLFDEIDDEFIQSFQKLYNEMRKPLGTLNNTIK